MPKKNNIVVSNPNRLHVHQQIYALQEKEYLQKFITSTWNKPGKFPYTYFQYFPKKLQTKIRDFLSKRYYEKILSGNVEQHPLIEITRVLLNQITKKIFNTRLLYWQSIFHDRIVAKRLAKLKPDIFIGYEISCVKSFEACKKLGIITILDLPNVHYNFSDPLEKLYEEEKYNHNLVQKISKRKEIELNLADYILCISTLAYQTLIDNGIPKEKIILIYLGSDSTIFNPKQQNENENEKFTILFVGSLIKRKGILLLLQAFKELDLPNADLVLIGPIADETILKPYQHLYTHIPYLTHSQLVAHYQNANIFVLPSYLDSWGMVVNEAMACGTPVLITENVGSKDIVKDNCGFVIPAGNIEVLKEKIDYCYHNRDKLKVMGQNAAKNVKDYTWENYHKSLLNFIENKLLLPRDV